MTLILSTFFDCLNVFVVVQHCIRERGTLGPLGQSFLKQGILVYAVTTTLNTMTIGTYFRVLMLRRKASPTETELRIQYSHMIDEAVEMIAIEYHPEETEGFTSSTSADAQAQA
ncbi:hypothetical protein H4582DRAFT_2054248 [Lactarius indigo]|nr:hypothetical protein H4582DRAFT_2054248 [Lactarius indigo]